MSKITASLKRSMDVGYCTECDKPSSRVWEIVTRAGGIIRICHRCKEALLTQFKGPRAGGE